MNYIEKTLMPDEKILYYTHPHWIVLYSPVLWLLLGVFLPIFSTGTAVNFVIFGHTLCGWATRFSFLMVIVSLISSFSSYITSEYAMTNKRIIVKTGVIRRNSFEIFLHRIESVQVTQSIFGRIMNYGIITIGGVGGSKDTFCYIPNPLIFRQKVQERLEQFSSRIDGK